MPFTRFLPLAPEISQFLSSQLETLKARGKLSEVVKQVLSQRFRVGAAVIFQAQWAEPLSLFEMAELLQATWTPKSASTRSVRGPGRSVERDPAVDLQAKLYRDEQMALGKKVSWGQASARFYGDGSRAAAKRLRSAVMYLEESGQTEN